MSRPVPAVERHKAGFKHECAAAVARSAFRQHRELRRGRVVEREQRGFWALGVFKVGRDKFRGLVVGLPDGHGGVFMQLPVPAGLR